MNNKNCFLWVAFTLLVAMGAAAQTVGEKFKAADGLYYKITRLTPAEATVVSQNDNYPKWNEADKPVGVLTIPATISYSGKTFDVTAIGGSAFRLCEKITSLVFAEGSKVVKIEQDAFGYCSNLTGKLTFPPSVKIIERRAFERCGITSVVLPENLESLEYSVFYVSRNLSGTILLPDKVKMQDNAFAGTNITAFAVSGSNTNYMVENGILFFLSRQRNTYSLSPR